MERITAEDYVYKWARVYNRTMGWQKRLGIYLKKHSNICKECTRFEGCERLGFNLRIREIFLKEGDCPDYASRWNKILISKKGDRNDMGIP